MLHSETITLTLGLWCFVLCILFEGVVCAQPFINDEVVVFEGYSVNGSHIQFLLAEYPYVSKIYVYLTDTFYADEDLKLNGVTELQIFANTWNVTKPVTFDLSGSDGSSQESAVNGSAGNSGHDGMNGGHFFGLANKIIHGEYLTISSNGGNGGDGQDGGASDDVYVLLSVDDNSGDNSGWFSHGDLQNYYKKYFDDRGYDTEISHIDDYTSLYAVFVHNKKASFNLRLHPRKCCGTTGIGGSGGTSGRSGKIIFRHVGNSSSNNKFESTPILKALNGHTGKLGKNGKTCESVALDVRIDTELSKVVFIFLPLHHSFSSHFTVLNHTNSSKCSPVYVKSNVTILSTKTNPSEIDLVSSVIRYKLFLLENMKNTSQTAIAQETYKAIDEDRKINDELSLRGLVLEACELERNYFELKKSIEVKPLYQRLFDRVQHLKLKKPNDDEHALSHLRSLLQFKLNDIEQEQEYNLIVDLERYAEVIVSNIDLRNKRSSTITNVNDVELQNNLNLLRFGVNGNFILAEYHHVIDGFRLTFFPFAVNYLENYILPASFLAYSDLDDIASVTTENLKDLSHSIREINSNNAEIVMNINWIQNAEPLGAFFVWNNSDVRDEIRELFEGKKITLFADVRQSKNRYNAIKYNSLELVFRASEENVNKQLKKVLQSFRVELNHTGRSAIRCNNNFYQFNTDPILTWTSFARDRHQVPYTRSLVYDKLRNNRPILSPYAFWEIEIAETNYLRQNFTGLEQFKELNIDIELHGTGKYIEENAPICENQNLEKFYTKV